MIRYWLFLLVQYLWAQTPI